MKYYNIGYRRDGEQMIADTNDELFNLMLGHIQRFFLWLQGVIVECVKLLVNVQPTARFRHL